MVDFYFLACLGRVGSPFQLHYIIIHKVSFPNINIFITDNVKPCFW